MSEVEEEHGADEGKGKGKGKGGGGERKRTGKGKGKVAGKEAGVALHRTGSTTESEEDVPAGHCQECRGRLDAEVEVPLWRGRSYHAKCFLCTGCRKTITSIVVAVKEQPYGTCCQPVGPVGPAGTPNCVACARPAAGPDLIAAHNTLYHAACFRCSACGHRIPAGAETLGLDSRPFHPACLRCVTCSTRIAADASAALAEDSGQPLCLLCAAARRPDCALCAAPVLPSDDARASLGRRFHAACLVCRTCSIPLSAAPALGPNLTCPPCAARNAAALILANAQDTHFPDRL